MSGREPENVELYPRPPAIEAVTMRARVEFGGGELVRTTDVVRVLETWHPPGIYLREDEFAPGALVRVEGAASFCEWKGVAHYFDVVGADGAIAPRAAWGYAQPTAGFEQLVGRVALYAGRVDTCWLDDERVTPQPGSFYGGWVTSWITGRIKGGPGTEGW